MNLSAYDELFAHLGSSKRGAKWAEQLQGELTTSVRGERDGNLPRWEEALEHLPEATGLVVLDQPQVTCQGSLETPRREALIRGLRGLMPWRKGPFRLFDIELDTEWRSDLKWARLEPHLDLAGKEILDVGCGNGYYGWRMLGAGAERVVGLDPTLLYVMQFLALRQYLGALPLHVVPAGDTAIPTNLRLFDTVFSMGVLYHRKSPIEHLQLLGHALKLGGELVLETLVIEGDDHQMLIPEHRYAQMANVWFLPTCALLERMVQRAGFKEVKVLDVTPTTVHEQRSTEWMTFDSLPEFLDPENPRRTIEGYPAPVRAILSARR